MAAASPPRGPRNSLERQTPGPSRAQGGVGTTFGVPGSLEGSDLRRWRPSSRPRELPRARPTRRSPTTAGSRVASSRVGGLITSGDNDTPGGTLAGEVDCDMQSCAFDCHGNPPPEDSWQRRAGRGSAAARLDPWTDTLRVVSGVVGGGESGE